MKLLRVSYKGKAFFGKLDGDYVTTLGEDYEESDNPIRIFLGDTKILSPVTPSKIMAVGLNYLDHIQEMGHEKPLSPVVFNKLPQCIAGPEDDILIPDSSDCVDYEAELAVVISRQCYKVTREEAKDYILGATCLNDVTYRKLQKIDGQWTRAKNYPTFCPIGPVIDTDVEYNNADIELLLNGEVKQRSNTRNFLWNVEELIEFISEFTVLYPGDVITTGTTSGVGPMYPGDKVEIVIKGIGRLVNYVV
jgi:2-keto-4-pentenoate hydratase/2-oxohepta-3-ene-1,7-dioic acid hydratase in catechol pathway